MERTEVETEYYGDPAPSGSNRLGYITYEEKEPYLVNHIRSLIGARVGERYICLSGYPKLTIHECWTGYSEYTITSQWSEVGIEWDGHSLYFESTAEFFKALSEVEESRW